MARRSVLPRLPDVSYSGNFPVISNSLDFLPDDLIFSRFGSRAGAFHCFVDDWRLESIWRDSIFSVDKAAASSVVVAPDFSIFPHYPAVYAKYQVWRSRLVSTWWQQHDVFVIPVLQWTHSQDKNLPDYFAGLEACEVVAVRSPSRGFEDDWLRCAEIFQSRYNPLVLHFGPKRGSEVWNTCRLLSLNPFQRKKQNKTT